MPQTVLKRAHLRDDKLGERGTYLVIELTQDHLQDGCEDVPSGTRGLVVGNRGKMSVVLFPHETFQIRQESFKDGQIRIVTSNKYKACGRIYFK